MKKICYLILSLLILSSASYAQKDSRAAAILDAMSDKYKATPAFKANFTYAMESPNANVKETFKGDITVKGPKYYLRMGSQEIINNGSTIWTYLKESNEVNISDYQPDENDITPSNIYTMYKKGYKYNFQEEFKEGGEVYQVVDLIPENKDSQVFKVKITVNKKDKSVKSWKIFEKNGNRYVYTLEKFTPSEVDDNFFAFDEKKYKDVEVVDLR